MKRLFFIALIFFIVFWSSGSINQKPESNAKVEVINGIEYIHNSETPLYPNKKVTFVEDLSLDGIDKDGNIIIYKPLLSFVDDNENIYIVEFQDQVIKVFGPDGEYHKTIGAKGSGPGEFQFISGFAATKDGIFLVTDQTARRTSFFNSSGKLLKSFQWRKNRTGLHLVKKSSYLTQERNYGRIQQRGVFSIKEIDFDGKEIRSYGEFTGSEHLIVRHNQGTSYSNMPDSPYSKFAGDQDRGLLYHCFTNQYIIEVYDISGKLFRKITRPYEPVPFTKKDAEKYRSGYKNHPREAVKKVVRNMKMPQVKTVVSRMTVDDAGYLWVRTNEKKEEDGKILTAFDIFNTDGLYYAKIWSEIYPYIFKKGRMYLMEVDQTTGYRTIKRYQVIWE